MKYLKKFESKSYELLIEDIFQELVDNGFKVGVEFLNPGKGYPKSMTGSIYIRITFPKGDFSDLTENYQEVFRPKDILDEILRLVDFIGDKYKCVVKFKNYLNSIPYILDIIDIETNLDKIGGITNEIIIQLYKPNMTYHVIWVNLDDDKQWSVLVADISLAEAHEELKKPLMSRYIRKEIITDDEYWIKERRRN